MSDKDKRSTPMTADRQVVALAECYVRLEALRIEMKRFADEIWLSMYGPRDDA